jgi:hypothetical protein
MVVALTNTHALEPPSTLIDPSKKEYEAVAYVSDEQTAYYSVSKPQAGAWTIFRRDSFSDARIAFEEAKPTVTGKVERSNSGARFKLRYDAKLRQGQSLEFYEAAGQFRRKIGKGGRSGDFLFRPADVPDRKRSIVALVTEDGAPTGVEVAVTKYAVKPAPLPSATNALVKKGPNGEPVYFLFSRKGGDIVVRWGEAFDASGYELKVTHQGGESELELTKKREARVKDVEPGEDLHFRVRAYNEDFQFGKPRTYGMARKDVPPKEKVQKKLPDPDTVGLIEIVAG